MVPEYYRRPVCRFTMTACTFPFQPFSKETPLRAINYAVPDVLLLARHSPPNPLSADPTASVVRRVAAPGTLAPAPDENKER